MTYLTHELQLIVIIAISFHNSLHEIRCLHFKIVLHDIETRLATIQAQISTIGLRFDAVIYFEVKMRNMKPVFQINLKEIGN